MVGLAASGKNSAKNDRAVSLGSVKRLPFQESKIVQLHGSSSADSV